MKDLTYSGFEKVDSSLWKKLVEHVWHEFEDKYWVDDGLQEECVNEFIIQVGGSDDESSDESDESRSDESIFESDSD